MPSELVLRRRAHMFSKENLEVLIAKKAQRVFLAEESVCKSADAEANGSGHGRDGGDAGVSGSEKQPFQCNNVE